MEPMRVVTDVAAARLAIIRDFIVEFIPLNDIVGGQSQGIQDQQANL